MFKKKGSSKKIRAVIVDDEELARRILVEYLGDHDEVTVAAQCANGFEAVKAITELKPDLVFLDIQMPKLNGLEVLELLDEQPAVIFVTAYDQYALKAFEVHAIDYLLKPFSRDRFEESLSRAKARISGKTQVARTDISEVVEKQKPAGRILVREGSKVIIIPADKIDYVEAQDDYVSIRASGKSHLKHQKLSDVEQILDPSRFVRIHRSYILNLECLERIEPYTKDSRVAILRDGTQLPVSKIGYEKLKQFL